MNEITDLLHQVMGSPWIYVALFALAFLDGFFPVVPGETAVITAGVFAATGSPNLYGVIAVAAVGAFLGDHVSYAIGRTFGARMLSRVKPDTRRHRALTRAREAIDVRGGMILVVARYIPGGRTAVTLTMGSMGFPLRRFAFYDAFAALSWAVYSTLIGYFGGLAFEQDPLLGLLLGLGIAVSITAVTELVRFALARRRRRAPAGRRELVGAER
ncbi:DedA family protein [Longispora urticae]